MKLRFYKVIIMNLFSVFLLMWFSTAAEETSIDMVEDAFAEFKEEDIRFLFWQKTNHTDYIPTHYNRKGSIDMKGIRSSGFNSSLNTIVITHGWTMNAFRHSMIEVKDAFLKKGNVNVISVDWSQVDPSYEYTRGIPFYWKSIELMPSMAQHIKQFLEKLDVSPKSLHLVGYSLGCHISGFVGKAMAGKVGRITGLDPAGLNFEGTNSSQRLDGTDAELVDVIHTAGQPLGIHKAVGDVDFYPNGGRSPQPGCQWYKNCSHGRSWIYFIESMFSTKAFPAKACSSWDKFQAGKCKGNRVEMMGYGVSKKAKGIFYLKTHSSPPFGKRTDQQKTEAQKSYTRSVLSYLKYEFGL